MDNPPSGQITSAQELKNLLEFTFPLDEIIYAFGYGSGVFSQQLEATKLSQDNNMVDMIIVVKDSYIFHKENLELNPHHYVASWFASDPAARITWWQRHALENSLLTNPRVYFNVLDGLKYGVVQVDDLVDDLKHWKYLYLAGRLHKPVQEIFDQSTTPDRESLSVPFYQQKCNLPAALSTALLLLSSNEQSTVSSARIYEQTAALSYAGDFRTSIGAEDPAKITKLVSAPGQLQRFHDLYQPSVNSLQEQGLLQVSSDDVWSWDSSASAREHLLQAVPSRLWHHHDLRKALARTVAPAARYQSMKGIFTAGLSRGAVYAFRKLSKGALRFLK
jgi:translocator assembly and maintenance protein 41